MANLSEKQLLELGITPEQVKAAKKKEILGRIADSKVEEHTSKAGKKYTGIKVSIGGRMPTIVFDEDHADVLIALGQHAKEQFANS